jgi:hypothetical protein
VIFIVNQLIGNCVTFTGSNQRTNQFGQITDFKIEITDSWRSRQSQTSTFVAFLVSLHSEWWINSLNEMKVNWMSHHFICLILIEDDHWDEKDDRNWKGDTLILWEETTWIAIEIGFVDYNQSCNLSLSLSHTHTHTQHNITHTYILLHFSHFFETSI